MPRSFRLGLAALALVLVALARRSDAQTAAADPAARGLDVFVHAPERAAAGGVLPLQVEAFGFPTVVTLVPLGGAAVEAAWNPEKLGANVHQVPPPVTATADASGRAHLDVPVPPGAEGPLELLVGVRLGSHARTRTLQVGRTLSSGDAEIHVADTRVVPGSSISAWVTVTSPETGKPVAGAPVDLALVEGGVARSLARLVTDPAGTAMARVPIPRSDEPAWSWKLEARPFPGTAAHPASVTLTPREETPGTPRLTAAFRQAGVLAGEKADYTIRVRDGSDQPIADLPVRVWTGPRGTTPPTDETEWLKASTRAMTNAAGEVTGSVATPTTVVRGAGTNVNLVARTNVGGHALDVDATVAVGVGTATAELVPEAQSIVPGVEQRMLLRVRDGHDGPIAAGFVVEGDGLRQEVRTDAWGEAEVTWRAPPDVGAARQVGPCAGGVAASVRVRPTGSVAALAGRAEPFELCVSVDREARVLVRTDRTAARMGEKVHVEVLPATPGEEAKRVAGAGGGAGAGVGAGAAPTRGPWSVVVRSANGGSPRSIWMDDGTKGADVELADGQEGVWSISVASPAMKSRAPLASAALLVAPRTLPKLTAAIAGGRAAPGGAVDVDATLADEHGRPLAGSIAALMIDAHGGGSTAGIEQLDTRTALCRPFDVPRERCDRLVEGDAALDAVRRAGLARNKTDPLQPAVDPGAGVTEQLSKSFADVLASLEGAVFQATATPEQLRDVRRKVGGAWQFNPELMTLVTAAMSEPPQTPGGEPLVLGDLLAVDPQVTFDNVARRITRLKLFRVLAAVRAFRHEHQLDDAEPALQNPNAILRRLVREGAITEDALLDPWGGTIQFAKSAGPPIPFLTAVRGFELHAPGPDGTLGTGDDVRDPFERVLRSGSPYAKAMQEDRIVDAKFEMEVGDATVDAWNSLFAELTGTQLGESFGAGGLSGVGEGGGGGHGEGIGLGGIGSIGHGHGRASFGIDTGVAFWAPPARTDDQGRLHLHVPLGDTETTWRLALVGLPDGGAPATATLEIPVALPLSARVDAGASWIEGDEATVAITVRNRSEHALVATVTTAAGGVAEIAEAAAPRTALVPAEGAVVTRVRVRARRAGTARLDVRVQAAGVPEDVVNHAWEVGAAGEPSDFMTAALVEDRADLKLTLPPQTVRVVGTPRLVLERGFDLAISGAIESLDEDALASPGALADAIELAGRVQRWATVNGGGEWGALAQRAGELARHATGRLAAYAAIDADAARVPMMRARVWAPAEMVNFLAKSPDCPEAATWEAFGALDAEPPATAGVTQACWDAFAAIAVQDVLASGSAVDLARAVLSLADKPRRVAVATSLADRLRERVKMDGSAAISLDGAFAASRAARSLVFAALLRAVRLGTRSTMGADRLAAWVLVQRDAKGGYGSPEATLAVVRALLAEGPQSKDPSHVTIESGGTRREVDVPPSAHVVVPLDPGATGVHLELGGQPVIARFERPVLRLWSHPPDEGTSPLHVETSWPAHVRAGQTALLTLSVRHTLSRAITADVRVPLPPGVTLAEPVKNVRQVQGVLTLRQALDASQLPATVQVPVRFGLAGRVTAPEAVAYVAFEDWARAVAPARPVIVLP